MLAFLEEAQQHGAVSEVVVVVRLLHKALLVFGGDKCQTPGGLNRSASGAARARQKLLTRRHGLRLESKQRLPTQLAAKIRTLLLKSNSPLATMLQGALHGGESHGGLFSTQEATPLVHLAQAFPQLKCLSGSNGVFLDWQSSVVRAAVVMLVAVQDESFFEAGFAKTNLESAGAVGDFNWHLMLPTSARVSPLTYSAVVATRYVALCAQQTGKWAIGTFARGGHRDLPPGFQTILWYAGWNKRGPGCAYAVSSMLRTLLSHQDWGRRS